MRSDLLVPDRCQHVTHGLRELVERDDIFIISQVQVKSDALGDVISEPPAGETSFVGGSRNCRVQPIAVELEELSRCCPQIWKFFFKRDHDFYLQARASEGLRWSSSALFPAKTTPAETH